MATSGDESSLTLVTLSHSNPLSEDQDISDVSNWRLEKQSLISYPGLEDLVQKKRERKREERNNNRIWKFLKDLRRKIPFLDVIIIAAAPS